MGYFDQYNPDLLTLIPPDAKTILEIGCGEGALCEAYRRVNPGVEWKGIDINEAAIKIAASKGVDGYFFDIDNATMIADDESADCIILGDILEHLKDPWTKLKRLTEIAKPGAQILASIPNVQHWSIIRDLLKGEWEYTDSGLLDRTHLRFFTLKSIRAMFDAAGLQIFECRGRRLFNEGFEAFRFDLGEGVVPQDAGVYQWVIRAIKPSVATLEDLGHPEWPSIVPCPIPKLHIHAVTAEDCCARPRILEPFAMLSTIPGVKCTTHPQFGSYGFDACHADILIQQRVRAISPMAQMDLLSRKPIVIAEVDDLPEAIGMDPMALKAVHAIQCSTEALAEVCRQYNPNVMVFENQIAELPPFDRVKKLPHDDTVRIFFGAQDRQADWASIMPALNRILTSHPGIHVTVVHDVDFFHALDISGPSTGKHFSPFCEYARYRRLIQRCDIALLPLEDTPFNRCKSDIKFLECAAEGVAMLCSQTVYRSVAGMGNPDSYVPRAWIYENGQHFEIMLRDLIEKAELRRYIAEKAYAYVRDNRLLSQHYRKRYDWYQWCITHKQHLTDQLLGRVPDMIELPATR